MKKRKETIKKKLKKKLNKEKGENKHTNIPSMFKVKFTFICGVPFGAGVIPATAILLKSK